nr:hypothetical protein [Variovorax paradoxus]
MPADQVAKIEDKVEIERVLSRLGDVDKGNSVTQFHVLREQANLMFAIKEPGLAVRPHPR